MINEDIPDENINVNSLHFEFGRYNDAFNGSLFSFFRKEVVSGHLF